MVRLFYSHFLDAYVLPILTILTKFINLNKGPILKEESHTEYKTYINLLSTLQEVAPRNPQSTACYILGGTDHLIFLLCFFRTMTQKLVLPGLCD